ncbi:MAG: hypothetical protein E2577_20260, partial [Starkeya sp.]|nr:hypothetical protein [Starkeya sp.]
MFKNDTFKRVGFNHTLSASTYNLVLGAVLLWGFGLNWWLVETVPAEAVNAIHPFVFIVGYFA